MKTFNRYFLSCVLTLLSLNFLPTNHSGLAAPEPQLKLGTLVCVVSHPDTDDGEANMDAVVLVQNGKLRQPYAEDSEAAQSKFAEQYFSAGRKYRLTFGGGEVGSVTVKSFKQGCNNIHASASMADNGKIPARLAALATNSESLGRKPGSRRAPTDAERAAINLLVEQIYSSRGANRAVIKSIVTTNLTATDLNGDGKFELIGSYTSETKAKARKDLLLIAEPAGTGFKAALVNFQAYQLIPEGFDSAIDFIDQLDLDGDGVAEVFTLQHGFDGYGYSIYKKQSGRWKVVYNATGDAC